MPLGDWLRQRGAQIEDVTELNKIIIAVSNKERATTLIKDELRESKT